MQNQAIATTKPHHLLTDSRDGEILLLRSLDFSKAYASRFLMKLAMKVLRRPISLISQIKCIIRNVSQQNKHCNIPTNKQKVIKLFYQNQMHYNYRLDVNILKRLIKRNILPTDPNKNTTYHT